MIPANLVPLLTDQFTRAPAVLIIPKILRPRGERRFMTFREFLEPLPDRFFGEVHFQRIGLDVI